ncbi:MAG: hypothetical protein IKH26_09825 [Bacteroidaceae bacterium]|jgi:hypothetical protein|nr:hypothetical protein [Bacteroidaceae bacterium]
MWKLSKAMMILSFVLVLVCLGASIWMTSVLKDTTSYLITGIFALAAVWLGINLFRKR